jgi:hypothetical protein
MKKVLLWTVILYCLIQILVVQKHKNPGDDSYILKEPTLDYDPWTRDHKGPIPKLNTKRDTTPYKGKWVDVN